MCGQPACSVVASTWMLASLDPLLARVPTSLYPNPRLTVSCCRAYANLMAPLLPTHKYRLDITPGNDASPGVRSAPFFGSQPLTTLEAGTPDTVSFTTQRLRDRVEYPQTRRNMRLKVRHRSDYIDRRPSGPRLGQCVDFHATHRKNLVMRERTCL